MRILHFLPVYVPAWQFGGPILSVSRLCEGLVQQGVDVRVITTNAGLPDFPTEQLGIPQTVNGVEVIYYPVDQERGIIRSRLLVAELSVHMKWAELLHLSSIWQPLGISVQKAAHAAGVPVIHTLRGALGPYSWRRGWWKKIPFFWLQERPCLQRAAALHCTTLQEAREIAWLGLKPPVQLLANPLDLTQLRYDPELGKSWRTSMGLPLDQPLFLVAGRLHHKKGLDLLPSVLKAVSDEPWKIVFVGQDDDGTATQLRAEFARVGLSERCRWLDSLPSGQLLGPYNAADWLLLPSRHENFGNVVAEALACGCGALVTPHVGCSENLSLCPGIKTVPRTIRDWITSIRLSLTDSKPGKCSSDWIFKQLSSQTISTQAVDIYTSII